MSQRLTVVLNGASQLEYDRSKDLSQDLLQYLTRMDKQMDQGIQLDGQYIAMPDGLQRARFVALQLLQAVQGENESMAAATCSYLAVRIPELKQVRAEVKEGHTSLDLVFDREYVPEQPLSFIKPEKLS